MKKFLSIIMLLFTFTLCSCNLLLEETDECSEGHLVEANYICDMTCPRCGKTLYKLDPTNEFRNYLDSIDYKDNYVKFFEKASLLYQYINDAFNAKSTEEISNIANLMSNDYYELLSIYAEFFMNNDYYFKYTSEYYIYDTDEKLEALNEFYEFYDELDYNYTCLVANMYFSPLCEYFFEKDTETEEYLASYINKKYEEEEPTGESSEEDTRSETQKRLDEIKSDITSSNQLNYDYDDVYDALYEYVNLQETLTPSRFNNYYEYRLFYYNSKKFTIDNCKTIFEFSKTVSKNYYDIFENNTLKADYPELYSIVKDYCNTKYNDDTFKIEHDYTTQQMVEFLMDCKNDNIDLFEIINKSYKEGYIFEGEGPNNNYAAYTITLDDDTRVIYYPYYGCYEPLSFVHEIGHFVDPHTNYTYLNEYTSTAMESLFLSYLLSELNLNTDEYREMVYCLINRHYFSNMIYYSLYEEVAYNLYSNYSDLDESFKDGISRDEYPLYFELIFDEYGFSIDEVSDVLRCSQHLILDAGYYIAYSMNYASSLNIFMESIDNYELVKNNFLNYLSLSGNMVEDLTNSGLDNPTDPSVYTRLVEYLDDFINEYK